jgi:hypothetical protein
MKFGPGVRIAFYLVAWTAACAVLSYGIGYRAGVTDQNRGDLERPDLANRADQFLHDHPPAVATSRPGD